MIYRIVQYIQPWEIDDFERQLRQLILGSYYVQEEDTIIIDVTLNVSSELVEWETSNISRDYFVNKYKYLETIAQQYFVAEFDHDENVQGCVDKRRLTCSKTQDFIIWLDPDLFFSKTTLAYLIQASKVITDDYFILSPQIIKYWDTSWDCLTAPEYLKEPFNHRDYFDAYSLDFSSDKTTISLKVNEQVKLGGGWFNLFNSNFFNRVPIPIELGSYGWEDTYVAICSSHIKIPQYLVEGVTVTEIGKRHLENKDYIKPLLNTKLTGKQKMLDQEFYKLLSNFR